MPGRGLRRANGDLHRDVSLNVGGGPRCTAQVLDRQLSIALKREQSTKRLQQQQSGGRPAKEQPEGKGAVEGAEEEEVKHHWRRRLLHFLHIRWVHTTMTALLILDLITVVVRCPFPLTHAQLARRDHSQG